MTSIIHHFLQAIHSSGMFCTGWLDLINRSATTLQPYDEGIYR